MGSTYIGPEHILFALAANPESGAGRLLSAAGVTPETLQRVLAGQGGPPGGRGPGSRSATPTLDEFGRDLTAMAREGGIDPVVGRDDEIEQTIEDAVPPDKNNPVLIGEAGVGKTAIVEGLAQRIVDDDVPETLAGKRVVQLELSGVVAGTRYRGDFEERVKRIIDEIREHRDGLIVFIDELHTLVGAGGSSEGGMDAGNMLKPALARGELHIVGATTLDEYRKTSRRTRRWPGGSSRSWCPSRPWTTRSRSCAGCATATRPTTRCGTPTRRWSPRSSCPTATSPTASCRIRRSTSSTRPVRGSGCGSPPPAGMCASWSGGPRNCSGTRTRPSPTSSTRTLRWLRDQISQVRQQLGDLGRRPVRGARGHGGGHRRGGVAGHRHPGPPAHRGGEGPAAAPGQLHGRVIGQDEAVEAVAEAVRRSRAGLGDPDRPVGSFLFLGPTGVGKTELARALAEALFGEDSRMIRLDMSEFQERHTVSLLVGAPPGYVGYDEAGQLTEAVRRLAVLRDPARRDREGPPGRVQHPAPGARRRPAHRWSGPDRGLQEHRPDHDQQPRIGPDHPPRRPARLRRQLGLDGSAQQDNLQEQFMRRLRESFRPEFLNRIDEIIIFRQLDETELRQITQLMLQETRRRLHAQHVTLEFTPAAVDWIAEHGFQPEFGARPMRRVIQREVDNELSRRLLDGQINPGQRVVVDVEDGHLTFVPHEQQVPAQAG